MVRLLLQKHYFCWLVILTLVLASSAKGLERASDDRPTLGSVYTGLSVGEMTEDEADSLKNSRALAPLYDSNALLQTPSIRRVRQQLAHMVLLYNRPISQLDVILLI